MGSIGGNQPPDFETRLAILQAKAQKEGVELTPDVLEFIAERIKQNIRELEGSLNRVVAYARLLRAWLLLSWPAKLWRILPPSNLKLRPLPLLLLETVASYFNLDVTDLRGSKRDKQTMFARQIAMYLLREKTDFSLSRIGRELGGRQPIIVSQAHKKISAEIAGNPELKQAIQEIQQKLSVVTAALKSEARSFLLTY